MNSIYNALHNKTLGVIIIIDFKPVAWSWGQISEQLHRERSISCCYYKGVCYMPGIRLLNSFVASAVSNVVITKAFVWSWCQTSENLESSARYQLLLLQGLAFENGSRPLNSVIACAISIMLLLQRCALLFNGCVEILWCFHWSDVWSENTFSWRRNVSHI